MAGDLTGTLRSLVRALFRMNRPTTDGIGRMSSVLYVRPACIQSNRCKSLARPIAGSAQPKTMVSVARPNLKEVGGKRLA